MTERAVRPRKGRSLVGLAAAVALATGGGIPGLVASAPGQVQVTASEPFYVVVTQDRAPLLAGPVETHYRVALLPQGTILRADFTTDGWVLVNYPAGTPAYVRASEVTPSPDAAVVRTNVATRLRAANMDSSGAGSWATLLADPLQPLPAGTELRVIGVENRADGAVQFYKVAAPDGARGYLRSALFRRATAQEAQDHANRLALAGRPGGPAQTPAPTPSTTTPSPAPTGPTQPAAAPGSTTPPATAPGSGGVDTSLLAEPVLPGASDRAVGTPEPLVINQAGAITGGPSPDARPPSADPVVVSLLALEAAFEEIRSQPVREAEYEELIARMENALNTLGTAPENERARLGLRARIDLLRLRQEYRDRLLELDEGRREAREAAARASERIDWLRTQGGYAVIGRLVPSSIYDGASGPLMYRVVAVNTDIPRTLAYIRMDDAFTLPSLVGKVVGVRGQVTIEPAVGTRIVQAESVDAVDFRN